MYCVSRLPNLSDAKLTRNQVYGVGAVLWEVLTGLPLPVPKDAETGESLDVEPLNPEWVRQMTFEPPPLDATSESFYSEELRNLIYAMLRHNAAARPSFSRILKKCLKFATSPDNPARGLRDAPANDARYQGRFRLVLPDVYSDKYAVGMSIDEVSIEEVDLGEYTGPKTEWPPSLPVSEEGDSDASDDLGGDPGAELEEDPGAQLGEDPGAQLEDDDDDDDSRRDGDGDGGLPC
jgi:serine/threonine protein kinase